jgi:hypothetical protein
MWRNATNRMLLIGATAAAGALIATPTVLGLSGNTSFTRDIRVPVPSGAQHVQPRDLTPSPSPSGQSPSESRHHHGGGAEDHPGHDVATSGATDDHGGLRTDNSGSGRGSSGPDQHGGGDDRSGRSGGGDG